LTYLGCDPPNMAAGSQQQEDPAACHRFMSSRPIRKKESGESRQHLGPNLVFLLPSIMWPHPRQSLVLPSSPSCPRDLHPCAITTGRHPCLPASPPAGNPRPIHWHPDWNTSMLSHCHDPHCTLRTTWKRRRWRAITKRSDNAVDVLDDLVERVKPRVDLGTG